MKAMLLLVIAGAMGISSMASAADGSVKPGGGTKATDAALLPAVKAGSSSKNTSSNAALLPAVKAGGTNKNTSSNAALLPAVKAGGTNKDTSSNGALLPATPASGAAIKGKSTEKAIWKQ
jgi:hypothetical protein